MARLHVPDRHPEWSLPTSLGWSTLPIKQRGFPPSEWKQPAVSSWSQFQKTRPAPEQVAGWARQGLGVGIVTGALSGIVVLDLDSAAAISEAETRGLPRTPSVETNKGRHYYFRHPGHEVRNRTRIFAGADIRGDGGYVVAPGTIHPGGTIYAWGAPPDDETPIAEMPDWLRALLTEQPKPKPEPNTSDSINAYVDAAIDGELAKLRKAPPGQRNDALNRAAFALGQFSHHPAAGHVRGLLEATARAIGLDEAEIPATINSGWSEGQKHPREIPPGRTHEGKGDQAKGERGQASSRRGLAAESSITAADLMSMQFPPIKWVVPGFIPEGLTLLAGAPKIGKSWMALGLAMAVAGGGKAFDEIKCDAGPVLYLALEDNLRRLQSRLHHMGVRSAPASLDLMTSWPTVDEDCVGQLELWLDDHSDARLIVVDVFAKIKSGKGGNRPQYDVDYKDVTSLQRLAIDRNVAIILVHHTRKMESEDPFDAVSGTRGLTGSADSTFVLTRATGQALPALYGRGRDIEEIEKEMSFDPATGRWTIAGNVIAMASTPERQIILDILKQATGPMALAAITESAKRSKSNVSNLLGKLIADGVVRRAATGAYELATPVGAARTPWGSKAPNESDESGE